MKYDRETRSKNNRSVIQNKVKRIWTPQKNLRNSFVTLKTCKQVQFNSNTDSQISIFHLFEFLFYLTNKKCATVIKKSQQRSFTLPDCT